MPSATTKKPATNENKYMLPSCRGLLPLVAGAAATPKTHNFQPVSPIVATVTTKYYNNYKRE